MSGADSFLGHPWASWIEILAVEPSSTMLGAFACTCRGALQIVLQSRMLQLQLRANRPETESPIRVTVDRSDGRCSAQRAALRIALNGWRAFAFALAGPDDWTDAEYASVCQVLLRCMYTNARIALARVPDEPLLAQIAQFTPFLVVLPSRASLQMLARPDIDQLILDRRLSGLKRCAVCVRVYGWRCCPRSKAMCFACRAYLFDKKRAKTWRRPINVRAHCAADRCIAIGKCFDCHLDPLMRTFHLCPCTDCRALPNDAFVHTECAAPWLTQTASTPTTVCIACDSQMCARSPEKFSLCIGCLGEQPQFDCSFCAQRDVPHLLECVTCRRHACIGCHSRWAFTAAGSRCPECAGEQPTGAEVLIGDNQVEPETIVEEQAEQQQQQQEDFESADSPLQF